MFAITLQSNVKRYLAYNDFRKKIFLANSPKDAPVILYLLPWLLSVNRPSVPGFVKDLKESFHVFNIENSRNILKQESIFKKTFNIKEEKSLIRHSSISMQILGIYTIGSAGTVSQTLRSDCDIWICIDKSAFSGKTLQYLNEKLNLLKDWLDVTLKIPVYFFINDIEAIKQCNFGSLDYECSGSTQKNVLKEEFYRTTILIEGKIPFWWVCYEKDKKIDYEQVFAENAVSDFGKQNFIDMGDINAVDQNEYFGASLWQFNKSLTHPLKSIIKMLQLKMFLEAPKEELLCHKLRRAILEGNAKENEFHDPSVFSMDAVLDYYSQHIREEYFEFIKKCFYLRFEMKLMSKVQTIRETIAGEVFKKYKLDRRDIYRLNEFESWRFQEKLNFGAMMFDFLTYIYKDIAQMQRSKKGAIEQQDLTIIGRKLASSIAVKNQKVPVLPVPIENLKLPVLTYSLTGKKWMVTSSDSPSSPLVTNENIMFCLAYIVWNGIYDPLQTRMLPNQTAVTLQEIINLGKKIKDVFGSFDISGVHFNNFLRKETISKILIIVSFEKPGMNTDIEDFCVIYKNNWEELFVRRCNSIDKLKVFLETVGKNAANLETHYYIQRNNKYYEKIIERTKNLVTQMLNNSYSTSLRLLVDNK